MIDSETSKLPKENIKLFREENKWMMERIPKLCEFYGINSEEDIKKFVQKIADEQTKFPVKLPDTLPEWSRAEEWIVEEDITPVNSVFADASFDDRNNYQYLNFVAQNLQSTSNIKVSVLRKF